MTLDGSFKENDYFFLLPYIHIQYKCSSKSVSFFFQKFSNLTDKISEEKFRRDPSTNVHNNLATKMEIMNSQQLELTLPCRDEITINLYNVGHAYVFQVSIPE